VVLKGSGFPVLPVGTYIEAVFEYVNSARVKYITSIDISTDRQMNFHVEEGEILEERRQFYKVNVTFDGLAVFLIRNGEIMSFDSPVQLKFLNLNLGGAFIKSPVAFKIGDQIRLKFLDGELELLSEILRVQRSERGEVSGYGCRFLDVTLSQEERLNKFIMETQIIEREKRMRTDQGEF
jgi:hypothetical protein